MFTPQEVQEYKFDKALFGGYDMSAVDDFLDKLTEDYSALFKENTLLKNKLKVLVGTVEEYRSVDEEMRRTLAAAKKNADAMLEETRRACEAMRAEASQETETMRARLVAETEGEERKLRAAQADTTKFLTAFRAMLSEQARWVDAFAAAPPPQPPRENRVDDVAAEVAAAVASRLQADIPAPESAAPEISAATAAPTIAEPAAPSTIDSAIQIFEVTLGQGVRPLASDEMRIPGEELEEDTIVPPPHEDFPDLQFGKDFKA